jgi:uncharacterized protein YuzE
MNKTPVKYDRQSDTLRIRLSDTAIEESDELEPGLIVDYDEAGNVVGIELLDASEIINQTIEPVHVGK